MKENGFIDFCVFAGLWAVVNNAGISFPTAPNDWLEIEDFKQMIDVNLIGVVAITLSVLPLIKKAKGRVVNVASVFGRISTLGGAYCITKYGVEAFNDSLRSVCPVTTSFFKYFDISRKNWSKKLKFNAFLRYKPMLYLGVAYAFISIYLMNAKSKQKETMCY